MATSLRGVDLNLLVILDALIDEAHVSRAAARLGLSQPATSAALDRCRRLFNDPLLKRSNNGMRLTARAEALRVPLRDLLAGVSDVVGREEPDVATVSRSQFPCAKARRAAPSRSASPRNRRDSPSGATMYG